MTDHAVESWRMLFENLNRDLDCPAKNIFLMAHSAGGRCVAEIFKRFGPSLKTKIKALIFTDAFYHEMFKDD